MSYKSNQTGSTSWDIRTKFRRKAALAASLSAISLNGFGQTAITTSDTARTSERRATEIEEVVVTATRVQASGFTAPTPTTVITEAQQRAVAPIQVSEALLLNPAFRTEGVSSSAAVYANLRSIGANRNLVLVDGRRHVATTAEGTMDLNLIPSSLVQRVEVVTGGASASWGSDAVAGVNNLILKTNLQGFEATAQYGESKYGDAETSVISLAGGSSFADGRGHVVIGGEYARDRGIGDLQTPDMARPWAYQMRGNLSNRDFATNGQPGVIYSRDIRRADTSAGGLITNGPLQGLTFNPDGSMRPFEYGQIYGNNMIGGGDNLGETLTPGSDARYPFERYSVLAHARYQLTDNIEGFVEGSYAHSLSNGHTNAIRFQGSVTANNTACTGTTAPSNLGGILVGIDNPFLPAATRDAMNDAGVTCIPVGRTFREMGTLEFDDGSPDVWRGVVGLRGQLANGWDWDGYYQYGTSESQQKRIGNLHMGRFRNAIDATVDPVTNEIVCRSALGGVDDGCIPLNIFGAGSVSPEAEAYVRGTSSLITDVEQTVAAFNLRGEAFTMPAGSVAVAMGLEYRKEELDSVADATSLINGWQTGNRKSASGSYDVHEVYGEAAIPLARGEAWADALDLSLAVRRADYSSSGGVNTWKVGTTWDINEQVRLRATRSRDIRAGNLAELFTPESTATVPGLRNPNTGDSSPALVETRGNRELAPEEADTTTMGIAYFPTWAPNLQMSIDYYDIEIDGAIGTLTAQQTIDRCYIDQIADFCNLIEIGPGGSISKVITTQLNLDQRETSGIDLEISYAFPLSQLWSRGVGDIRARLLANYIDQLATTAAVDARVTDPVGEYTTPQWTVFGLLTYDLGAFTGTLDARWYDGGTIDNTLTKGEISPTGININDVGSTTYLNTTFTYRFGADQNTEFFLRVNNLLNEPPPFPNIGTGIFDEVGRAYRIGVRWNY